jgi:PAS domain S-box-containing protein
MTINKQLKSPSGNTSIRNIVATMEENLQTQQRFHRLQKEFYTIFDSVPAMIWYRDKTGTILRANRCAADSVGMSVQQLKGRNYYELFPDGADMALEKDLQVILSGQPLREQLRQFLTSQGQIRWAMVDRIPYRDEDNHIAGVIVFAQDITERKEAEDSLLTAKEEIERINLSLKTAAERATILAEEALVASQAKGDFLAAMSHELRTPMNAILGFTEILLSENLTEDQGHYIKTIHRSAQNLLSLINDILDFSKIEAGKLHIEIELCNIDEILGEIRDLLEMSAVKKGLEFRIERTSSVPETFFTDAMRLRQCLLNLLGNAIKFTQQGHVCLRVGAETSKEQPQITWAVEDTGIGIAPEKQKSLFESFVQADVMTERKYGGTGLGLAITRRLCGLMGGHINVQSQPGCGSSFTAVLPLCSDRQQLISQIQQNNKSEKPTSREKPSHTAPCKLLVIEDHSPSQLVMNLLLRREGVDVRLVPSEPQRIQNALDEKPDLILLDMQITGLNPFELIRSFQRQGITVSIIAVMDEMSESLQKQLKEMGCRECLVKPVTREELYHAIQECLHDITDRTQSANIQSGHLWSEPQIHTQRKELIDKLPSLLEIVPELLSQSKMETLKRLVHLLVEIGDAAQMPSLKQSASRLEELTKQPNIRPEQMDRMVQDLKEACTSIYKSQNMVPVR